MIVNNEHEYERRALELAAGLVYDTIPADPSKPPTTLEGREQRRSKGELAELRKKLFLTREQSPLFDTKRWVRNLEKVCPQSCSGVSASPLNGFRYRVWSKPGRAGSRAPSLKTPPNGPQAPAGQAPPSSSRTTWTAPISNLASLTSDTLSFSLLYLLAVAVHSIAYRFSSFLRKLQLRISCPIQTERAPPLLPLSSLRRCSLTA